MVVCFKSDYIRVVHVLLQPVIDMSGEVKKKKILENPMASGVIVPIAVVLVGALVVFGVTKLLSSERSYKDLVREMHTKTLGNRWVAAFELSKLISSSQIPKEDIPWLITNLKEIYGDAKDPRTRQFTVVAAGALRNDTSSELLEMAINDEDEKVRFHALVALGNMPKGAKFSRWPAVVAYLDNKDVGVVQAAALTLATHQVPEAQERLENLLSHPNKVLRFTVASGLANYKSEKAIPTLKEILFLKPSSSTTSSFQPQQVEALKLSLMNSLERNEWSVLKKEIAVVAKQDKSLKVAARAEQLLKILKN
jgi:HEAT repeat protein